MKVEMKHWIALTFALTSLFLTAQSHAVGDTGPAWWDEIQYRTDNEKLWIRSGEPYRVRAGVKSGFRPVYRIPDSPNAAWVVIGRVAVGQACGMDELAVGKANYRAVVTEDGKEGMTLCSGSLRCLWVRTAALPQWLAILQGSGEWKSVPVAWDKLPRQALSKEDAEICRAVK